VILTNVIGFDVKVWDPGAPVLDGGNNVALVPGDPGYSAVVNTATHISYGAYADLGWGLAGSYSKPGTAPTPHFNGLGLQESGLRYDTGGTDPSRSKFTYDTWSFHYEHDGWRDIDNDGVVDGPAEGDQDTDGVVDEGTDGFDNNSDGVVDDVDELETRPPYPYPLRGVQVKIRVFEPDGRQVREVTVVQDFLPK
jgi:hypothetical protein